MSYSRWGGSNWYSYANAEGLVAHFAEGHSYYFTESEVREDIEGCVAQVKDGNEYDKAELREIMAANCWHFAHTFLGQCPQNAHSFQTTARTIFAHHTDDFHRQFRKSTPTFFPSCLPCLVP